MEKKENKNKVWLEIIKILIPGIFGYFLAIYTTTSQHNDQLTMSHHQDSLDEIRRIHSDYEDSIKNVRREFTDSVSNSHKDSLERMGRLQSLNLAILQILHSDTIARANQTFELKKLKKQDQINSFRE